MKFMLIIIGIVICIIICFLLYCAISDFINRDKIKEKQVENMNKLKNMLKENGLIENNIRTYLCLNKEQGCLIFTRDGRFFQIKNDISQPLSFGIREIKLSNILDIDIMLSSQEHNKMKVVSLTPTFTNYKYIQGANLKIITEYSTFNFTINKKSEIFDITTLAKIHMPKNYWIAKDIFGIKNNIKLSLSQSIDEMKRLKLLIEKEMKNLNKAN